MAFNDPIVLASPSSLSKFARDYFDESLPAMVALLNTAYDDGVVVVAPTLYRTPQLTPRQWPWMTVVSDRLGFAEYAGTERQYEGSHIALLEVSTNREVVGDYDPDFVLHSLAERTVWAIARVLRDDHTMGGRVEHARFEEGIMPSVFENEAINVISETEARSTAPSVYARRAAVVFRVEQSDT